jgi:hypothetical protein
MSMLRFPIRVLLWPTVVVALGGCIGGSGDTDEIQYFPPGPEFKKSERADGLPDTSAPAPKLPSD